MSVAYNGLSAWLCLMLCRIDGQLFQSLECSPRTAPDKADRCHKVFICAAVINWITQKEPVPPSYQDKPWGVPRYPGTDWTTLVGDSSIPGPRPVRALGSLGGDAHPGSLVPGSLHLGRLGNSGEDLQRSNASVRSTPESKNYATGSAGTSIGQERSEDEPDDRQHVES